MAYTACTCRYDALDPKHADLVTPGNIPPQTLDATSTQDSSLTHT